MTDNPPPLPDQPVSVLIVSSLLSSIDVPPDAPTHGELAGKSTPVTVFIVPVVESVQSLEPLSPEAANIVWPSAAPCLKRSLSLRTSFGSSSISHKPNEVVTT